MKKKRKLIGMTIIEALVAIAIFTIGIAGFARLFVISWRSNSYALEMGQSSLAASQGVNAIVGYLRRARQADDGAYAVKSANDNDLVVFSDYDKDGATERLHLYLQSGQIKMGATKPTTSIPKTYPSGDQTTRIIAEKIVNDASTPVFYYYNKDYPGDQINNPVPTPADISDIRLIKIYLKINIDPNRAPDNIEVESFSELRNLNDYDRIQ